MKKSILITVVFILLSFIVTLEGVQEKRINVGVYNGFGASAGCITDTLESLKIDPAIIPLEISAADILKGGLNKLDVLVIPGGSGSRQTQNMGFLAAQKVKDFVLKEGKGLVGICAGAYLLSDTPGYACLHIFPVEAIDRVHDERGYGIIEFKINNKGLEIFPELKEREKNYVYYYEGPVCIPAKQNKTPFNQLATMVSDVHHKEGAPAGMTPGKPLYMTAKVGKGNVFISVGHPETTPGMRWMVPRMVRWTIGKKLIPYPGSVVRPDIYSGEILFDKEMRKQEQDLFQVLIYGKSAEKIAAMETLVKVHSWSARYWFAGLLRDADPGVRLAAAKALVAIEYTSAIEDLKSLIPLETDENNKKELKNYLTKMEQMIGTM